MNKDDLVKELTAYGQEHLVQFWDELNESDKEHLYHEIKQTDFGELNGFYERVQSEMSQNALELDHAMNPIPDNLKGSYAHSSPEQLRVYELDGLRAVSNNQVAVLLMAGGQGTRLGVQYPKGMYSVNLLSGKSLYQLQAERILRLQELAKKEFPENSPNPIIPWYIMTSEHTQELTEEYFKKNNCFGLESSNIMFFEQFMLPCLTNDGKVILDQKHKISRSPDGNGGLYKALLKRHVLDDMSKRDIKYVHVYGVDNILIKLADPVFIGFCIEKNANCAAKVVKKTDPDEKVGVICKVHDRFQVVEYSEISQVTRNLRDEKGDLLYNAGSICNHFFSTKFLNEVCRNHEKDLKNHVAEKKIPYINEQGERITPKTNNGIKLEKFVFDVFPFSTSFAIWEVYREEEFSPLKNSDDAKNETPTTCRHDLYSQHYRWLLKSGAQFEETDNKNIECEISPLVSYNGEHLEEFAKGKVFKTPLHVESDKETGKPCITNKTSL